MNDLMYKFGSHCTEPFLVFIHDLMKFYCKL